VIAGKAIALKEALQPEFKAYAQQIIANAQAMAEVFAADERIKIISGGTDNHLMLLDVTKFGLTGRDVQDLLDTVSITVNKNTIPNEQNGPFRTSGIRVGTPAITTRGMKEAEAKQVAQLILRAIEQREDPNALAEVKRDVFALTEQFPINAKRFEF